MELNSFFFSWICFVVPYYRATLIVFWSILQVENHQIQQVGRVPRIGVTDHWSLIHEFNVAWNERGIHSLTTEKNLVCWPFKIILPDTSDLISVAWKGARNSQQNIWQHDPSITISHRIKILWSIYPMDQKCIRSSTPISIKMNPLRVSISTESFRPDVSNKQSPASLSTSPSVNTKTTLPKEKSQVFQRWCLVKMFFLTRKENNIAKCLVLAASKDHRLCSWYSSQLH